VSESCIQPGSHPPRKHSRSHRQSGTGKTHKTTTHNTGNRETAWKQRAMAWGGMRDRICWRALTPLVLASSPACPSIATSQGSHLPVWLWGFPSCPEPPAGWSRTYCPRRWSPAAHHSWGRQRRWESYNVFRDRCGI